MRLRFSWQQDSYMIWVMTLCSLVGGYHSFGEPYCLILQGPYGCSGQNIQVGKGVGRIERQERLLFFLSNLEQFNSEQLHYMEAYWYFAFF
jgi:hypothetical protein